MHNRKSNSQKTNVVTIYTDPLTKLKPEGKARLLKRVSGNRWEVQFLSDGFKTERFV